MKVKITTYIDEEKLFAEQYDCTFLEEKIVDTLVYIDKNKKKIKITVDKLKERVTIEKDNLITKIAYTREKSDYSTSYGALKLESQLVKLEKKQRGSFIVFDIVYNLYFNKEDKQQNKLRLQIKK